VRSLGGGLRQIEDTAQTGGAGPRRLVYTNLPRKAEAPREGSANGVPSCDVPRRRPPRGGLGRLLAPLDAVSLPPRLGLYLAAALMAGAGLYGAFLGGHVASARAGIGGAFDQVTARAGLAVQSVVITGHAEVREADILRALEIGDATSLLTFDAHWARQRLGEIAWVKSATVQKLLPGTLRIDIVERQPYALWQLGGIVSIIDRDGEVIGELGDERFANLPLVVGSGANTRIDDLMAMIEPYQAVSTRLRAAVRVADRRWNLKLDNGVEIRLPETDPGAALTVLEDLAEDHGLMARDIVLIDLRLADRVVVRLSDEAAVQRNAAIKAQGAAKSRKGQDT